MLSSSVTLLDWTCILNNIKGICSISYGVFRNLLYYSMGLAVYILEAVACDSYMRGSELIEYLKVGRVFGS